MITTFIFVPVLSVLLYLGLRRAKKARIIYCIILVISFLPTIPFFFFFLNYSSITFRNLLLLLFLSIAIAALIQKGLVQKIILISIIISIISWGVPHPGTYDISKKFEVEKFEVDNYSFILEKTGQSTADLLHWRGKKYIAKNMLYEWLSISDSSTNTNKCIQTLYVNHVDNYDTGAMTLETIINYDTCENKIVSLMKGTNR